jgi:streptogramin lyase
MHSRFLQHAAVLSLFLAAIVASPARAAQPAVPGPTEPPAVAEPTLYQLPAATHARSLAVTDRAAWFSPSRGEKWDGAPGPALGYVSADGTVAEVPLSAPGFGEPVLGPEGEVWVSGKSTNETGEDVLQIARVGASGQIEATYTVGRGRDAITAMAVTPRSVWFAQQRDRGRFSIGRLSLVDATVRRFTLRPHCRAEALAVAQNGAAWYTEACLIRKHGEVGPGGSSIVRIDRRGDIRRWRLAGKDYPMSIALGHDGTVWFGVSRWGFSAWQVGRISPGGALAEYPVPHGYPRWIAVGPRGRLWFQSSFGGGIYRALNSIGERGKLGTPICADPACELEPTNLTGATDGSLWYSLIKPHTIGGGGETQILEGMAIANEAGFIGHLVP